MTFKQLIDKLLHDIQSRAVDLQLENVDRIEEFRRFADEEGCVEAAGLLANLRKMLRDKADRDGCYDIIEKLRGELSGKSLLSVEPEFMCRKAEVHVLRGRDRMLLGIVADAPVVQRAMKVVLTGMVPMYRDYSREYRLRDLLQKPGTIVSCPWYMVEKLRQHGFASQELVCMGLLARTDLSCKPWFVLLGDGDQAATTGRGDSEPQEERSA